MGTRQHKDKMPRNQQRIATKWHTLFRERKRINWRQGRKGTWGRPVDLIWRTYWQKEQIWEIQVFKVYRHRACWKNMGLFSTKSSITESTFPLVSHRNVTNLKNPERDWIVSSVFFNVAIWYLCCYANGLQCGQTPPCQFHSTNRCYLWMELSPLNNEMQAARKWLNLQWKNPVFNMAWMLSWPLENQGKNVQTLKAELLLSSPFHPRTL